MPVPRQRLRRPPAVIHDSSVEEEEDSEKELDENVDQDNLNDVDQDNDQEATSNADDDLQELGSAASASLRQKMASEVCQSDLILKHLILSSTGI